jgi:prephenate dehydratase
MRIAIQGASGSFHHVAAKQWFGDSIAIAPAESFSEVFGLLNRHEADAGIVAIENSLYGSISQVYDLIEAHGYPIIGEIHLPIHQQLIGLTADVAIERIYSHPVALAQCENYLDIHHPNAERIEYHDTAAAVEHIKELGQPGYAAIAGDQAAIEHDLPIIARNIEDNPANFTRFLVIQPHGSIPTNANRTSLVIQTDHTPGALAAVLSIFANAGINLAKLQSRPIIGSPWTYRFYLVIDAADDSAKEALDAVRPLTTSLTILGQYHSESADK